MSFTKIRELTVTEFVSLAFTQFGHRTFTISALSHHLCLLLSDSFKVSQVKLVDGLNRMALEQGLVRVSQSKSAGVGFEVTEQGVQDAAEIELPRDRFEHYAKLQEERTREASSNAGPVFEALLNTIPEKDVYGRAFIENVFKHWWTHRWLSSKQAAAIAQIGARYGKFVKAQHYVGAALEVWIVPYSAGQAEELAADEPTRDVHSRS